MKKNTLWILTIAALLTANCPADAETQEPLITISGSAKVVVSPDSAEFEFGVESRNASLSEAQSDSEQRTKAIIGALKKLGVDNKDIKADEITAQPYFGQDDSKTKPIHFSISRHISVKLRDISKFEAVLTAALKTGATHVRKAEKQSSDLRQHKDEARVLAARAAREKAELLAKELGVKVGRAFSIQETSNDWYSNLRNVAQNNVSEEPTDGSSLNAGMIEVSSSVQVSFRIE